MPKIKTLLIINHIYYLHIKSQSKNKWRQININDKKVGNGENSKNAIKTEWKQKKQQK